MNNYRATAPDGTVTDYEADLPDPAHLTAGWRLEEIIAIAPSPDEFPAPVTVYGGRRRISKLELIALLGPAAYVAILSMARESVEVEAWVKQIELAAQDVDGNSISLDDPRTAYGLQAIEPALIGSGAVSAGWAQGVLNG